jgi:hypothetical protein
MLCGSPHLCTSLTQKKGCSELPEQPFVFLRESFGSRSRQQERDVPLFGFRPSAGFQEAELIPAVELAPLSFANSSRNEHQNPNFTEKTWLASKNWADRYA